MSRQVLDALTGTFGENIQTGSQHGDEWVSCVRDQLIPVATFLRDDSAMAFDCPVFATAIDWLGLGREPRFEAVWQLRSSVHLHRIRIRVAVAEDDIVVPSLTPLWKGFGWPEREAFDMYGIRYEGHDDLRRILMYEQFVGHPLRKDYPKEKRQPLVRRDGMSD